MQITLAHGSGGKMSQDLIRDVFMKHLGNETLNKVDDAAVLQAGTGKIAFTTDTFVIKPVFFPGGNIGNLAVCGTVNDLAVTGAKPVALSAGFIIEEGFSINDLEAIVISMSECAKEAGVQIVTGDTKVVGKGEADGIFINTSGIGTIEASVDLDVSKISVGDKVIVTGTLGDHALAILSKREGLSFETALISDSAPLNKMLIGLVEEVPMIKFMRDPTRGGVAATLNEISNDRDFGILLDENTLPVSEGVAGACELLGMDPLYLANEGKALVVVGKDNADKAIATLKKNKYGKDATIIGEITSENAGKVCLKTRLGVVRIVDMPVGEQLPRIC
jgi:hydrogenase expression/formation protein HypE